MLQETTSCYKIKIIPKFGTVCSKLWYYLFQTVVLSVPNRGIVCTKPRYCLYQTAEHTSYGGNLSLPWMGEG
jgi:hypothetical protein